MKRFITTRIRLYHGKCGAKGKTRIYRVLGHQCPQEGWLKTTKMLGMSRWTLRAVLCRVIDAKNFDGFECDAINGDVRQRENGSSRVPSSRPPTATVRPLFQGADGLVQLAHGRLAVSRMVFLEVVVDVLQVRCGGWRPANSHRLRAQHLLQAGVHFFFFDELAAVGLGDAFADGGAKAGILFEKTQGGLFHQKLGVGPSASCSGVKWTSMVLA